MKIIEDSNVELLKNDKDKNFKRNYGIDLLKILAMINIINLHINKFSFNLRLNPDNPKYKNVYRLQILSFWPVDTFGIISGLVSFKKYKFSNVIYIWFEYFFYSIFFAIYQYMKSLKNIRFVILSFFPIGINRFWYANTFIFLYLFLPFINNYIISANKNYFSKLIGVYFFFYSFYHKLMQYNIGKTDFDYINEGYSTIWLMVLYILGGYLGRFFLNNKYLSNHVYFMIYIFSSFLTSEYTFYTYKKNKFANKILISYNSPTILIQSLSLIFLFYNLEIKNKYIQKMILFFIPLNFNVALIHLIVFQFKTRFIFNFFDYINQLKKNFLFFKIYGISIIIYIICAIFDYFRFILFKSINIKKFCIFIEEKYLNNSR